MKISELRLMLKRLQDGCGDLEVRACAGLGDERPVVGGHGTQGNGAYVTLNLSPKAKG